MVEAQSRSTTRKLVDSAEEHQLLEEAIEATKPDRVLSSIRQRLHYLLWTPFRYPPLRYGSRFGPRRAMGLWYGSLEDRAALAERAYYLLIFLEDTSADIRLEGSWTLFRTALKTEIGVVLTETPFNSFREKISSKTSYAVSQALGEAMRKDGVEAFTYFSARDTENGINVGAFSPTVFSESTITDMSTWQSFATRQSVEFHFPGLVKGERRLFSREQFTVGGKLPRPAP